MHRFHESNIPYFARIGLDVRRSVWLAHASILLKYENETDVVKKTGIGLGKILDRKNFCVCMRHRRRTSKYPCKLGFSARIYRKAVFGTWWGWIS